MSDQTSRMMANRAAAAGDIKNPFAAAGGGPGGPDYSDLFRVYEYQKKALKELNDIAADREKEAAAQAKAEEKLNQSYDNQAESLRQLIDPTRVYRQRMVDAEELALKGKISQDELSAALAKYQEQIDKVLAKDLPKNIQDTDKMAQQLGLTLSSAAGKAITDFKNLGAVIRGVALDIEQMMLKATVLDPINKSVTDLVKGSGFSDWFSGLWGGGKAIGGPVDAGVSYLVGEQGPEVFTPSSSGSITPNGALGAGGSMTVHFTVNALDPRGALQVISPLKNIITGWTQKAWNARGVSTPTG